VSKHKARPQPPATPSSPPAGTPSRFGPDLLRRTVLVLVTALIVARPLVPGEDPGLLGPRANAGGLVLTFLWLAAATGWAGWRLWSGQGTWRGGLVEAALAVVALLFLGAAAAASYRHPAWLIAWEWLVLLVAFSLVRQLAESEAERRGLLAAVLAGAVSLSAYAVYQAGYELPARHQSAVHATFTLPSSFAGTLALVLPATAGCGIVAWRRRLSTWQPVLALGCAGLVAAALVLTECRAAILASALVGTALVAWFGRDFLRAHSLTALGGLVAVLAVAVLAGRLEPVQAALGRAGQALGQRFDVWSAAWGMIRDHPWLGVGPGNFSRHYPRYMVPTAADTAVADPHSFALEVWAGGGVFALLALLAAFAALGYRLSAIGQPTQPTADSRQPIADVRDWPFYLGGMTGLLMGLLLRTTGALEPDAIVREAGATCGQALVWFAAFALFASIPWSGPSLVLSLAAGVAACLLSLTVAPGIAFPAVAQPLWVVAALAVSGIPARVPAWSSRHPLGRFMPLPLLGGLCLTYFLLVLFPVSNCDNHLRHARMTQKLAAELSRSPKKEKKEQEAPRQARAATALLQQAHRDDPLNVTPLVELARWHMEVSSPRSPAEGEPVLKYLDAAQELDPLGKEPKQLAFQLRLRLAEGLKDKDKAKRDTELQAATAFLDAILAVDPTEAARLHCRLAETYLWLNDLAEGHRLEELALAEDREAPGPAYRLTRPQVAQIWGWEKARFVRMQMGAVLAAGPGGPLQILPALLLKPDRMAEARVPLSR
jgi:O-antigen ligase